MKLLVFAPFVSWACFAGTWSGVLVNAECYTIDEQNVTLRSPDTNHDRDFEIDQCAPNAKTKTFAVVDRDGQSVNLDAEGNRKAAELAAKSPRKGRVYVEVSGEKSGTTVKVASIVRR